MFQAILGVMFMHVPAATVFQNNNTIMYASFGLLFVQGMAHALLCIAQQPSGHE